jgi:hypothetical protein
LLLINSRFPTFQFGVAVDGDPAGFFWLFGLLLVLLLKTVPGWTVDDRGRRSSSWYKNIQKPSTRNTLVNQPAESCFPNFPICYMVIHGGDCPQFGCVRRYAFGIPMLNYISIPSDKHGQLNPACLDENHLSNLGLLANLKIALQLPPNSNPI